MTTGPVLIDRALLRSLPLPALPEQSDKDDRGQVLVIGGGPCVPGAPLLTGLAALRVGAGKLQLAATRPSAFALGIAAPEAAIVGAYGEADGELGLQSFQVLCEAASRADAVVIGPGMMGDGASALAVALIEALPDIPFVADAAALQSLLALAAPNAADRAKLVITPHAGEMATLLGWSRERVIASPDAAARQAAHDLGAVVALKGVETRIASPDGRMWLYAGGSVGLGTSGSGDVLAGVIGGLLARGAKPEEAAIRGVFIHGAAGAQLSQSIGVVGFLAREIVDALPAALADSHPGQTRR